MSTAQNMAIVIVPLLALARILYIVWAERGHRDRDEQAMVQRVCDVLDTVEAEDPEFVAEARALRDVLVPNAWAMRVGTQAAKSNLSADAKVAITRAIYPHRKPTGATA